MGAPTLEQQYFLPTYMQSLSDEWGGGMQTSLRPRQQTYVEACVNTVDRIALMLQEQIAQGVIDDSLFEQTYKIAMEERRAMAFHSRASKPDSWASYGVPVKGRGLKDFIYPEQTRYGHLYEAIMEKLEGRFTNGKLRRDEGHTIRNNIRPLSIVTLNKDGLQADNEIVFTHASTQQRHDMFERCQESLQMAIAHREDPQQFSYYLAMLAKDLFQGNQASLGGQTINLVMIAAVLKGCGYSLTPMTPMFDHYIDPEVMTSDEYIESFHERFQEPLTYAPEAVSINYNPDFWEEKGLDWTTRFSSDLPKDLLTRLNAFVDQMWNNRGEPIIQSCRYNSRTHEIEIECREGRSLYQSHQMALEQMIDFIGSEQLMIEIGLGEEVAQIKQQDSTLLNQLLGNSGEKKGFSFWN